MPRMNGIDMIKKIREEDELRDTPIIVMSAYGKRMIDDALDAGADDFVEKPIDFDKFLTTVKSRLPTA
jgi:CheY-like chemotaxis protein